MSYVALSGVVVAFGAEGDDVGSCPWQFTWASPNSDFCPFARKQWTPSEVYVMRLTVDGAPDLDTATKAMAWAEAYGDGTTVPLLPEQEIKGVVVRKLGDAPGVWKIEIVVTVPTSSTFITTPPPPEGMYIDALEKSALLRARWPNFRVTGFQSLQLLRPAGQINDWRAASSVWSAALKKSTGTGTTKAGSTSQNTWLGGTAAHPQARFPAPEPPPVGPPGPGEEKKGESSNLPLVVLGVVAVVGGAYWVSKKRKTP